MERELKLAGNRSLAEYNIGQGTKLTDCKSRLAQLYEQLNQQTKQFDENKHILGGLDKMVILMNCLENECRHCSQIILNNTYTSAQRKCEKSSSCLMQ